MGQSILYSMQPQGVCLFQSMTTLSGIEVGISVDQSGYLFGSTLHITQLLSEQTELSACIRLNTQGHQEN